MNLFVPEEEAVVAKMDQPVACMPMNPIFGSYARFFIGVVNSFKPVLGVKNVFRLPNGLAINRVEVFAFVTEKVEKEDCLKITLNDGTGSILCIINKQGKMSRYYQTEPTVREVTEKNVRQACESYNTCITFQSELLSSRNKSTELCDFVVIRARLITSRWCSTPHLVSLKMRHVEEPVLKEWSKWTEKTIFLYENVYSKAIFDMLHKDDEAVKS